MNLQKIMDSAILMSPLLPDQNTHFKTDNSGRQGVDKGYSPARRLVMTILAASSMEAKDRSVQHMSNSESELNEFAEKGKF